MSWKRALFVGCSHGLHADEKALLAVLKFKREYKPHTVVHLGDFCDTAAFRSGAHGTSDESTPVTPDVDAGLDFIKALGCTHIFCGNHEGRLWRMRASPNAIVSYAASQVVGIIEGAAQKLRADFIPYTGVWQSRTFGNFKAMHGTMYGENATRDHAEAHGNVIHAHTHRAAVAKGRRDDNPTGYCVGTLTRASDMDYANTRRATLAWSQGFVWGEYNDTQSVWWLHEQPMNATEWRLP